MKIVIIGPGAMGCLVAAFLAKSFSSSKGEEHKIWILDKDRDRALKINQQGIIVEGVTGNWQVKVKVATKPQEIDKCDLIIICVKSYDTKEVVLQTKTLIGDNTEVLTLQNGIGNIEVIGEAVGLDKVIAGVTSQAATLLGIGHIRHAGKGETVIGRIDGKTPVELRYVREIFNKAGLDTKISRDIKSLLWSKLVINVGINALTAIVRLNNGRLIEFEGTRRILRGAVTEAIRIAKRKKIKLIYDDPLAKVEAVCEATSANISSMLQDISRNKRTEIDFINGVIVRLGQECGIPVPVNLILLDLIKTIESSYALSVKS